MSPPPKFTPIAICGMACRLPGGIDSPNELWDFLLSKGDARTLVPESRFNISGYYSDSKKPGTTRTQYGYFLDESTDLGALDTSFFPMARKELENLDPQQRLLLEVTRECIDDAGVVECKGKNIGVYIGSFGNDWYDLALADHQKSDLYQVSTGHDFALSNRISYEMDLRGPSITIRTACSSSLVALSEACSSIARGECTSAVVGGSNIILTPSLTTNISQQGALSPEGSCKTFSSLADGYARGEGVVVFYIKPLQDALRDGNPIRSVIVGAATNCDGKTPGLSVPSSAAHEALIRDTYRLSGIPPEELLKTGYFECHGTGTPIGDPIEANAVFRVFEDGGGIHLGSVKPNLGHGEGASGLSALMKVVLALEHRLIPPTIKSLPLNPKIPFGSNQLITPTESTPWPADRYERASVNSFGIGGSNAHIIVDSAARFGVHRAEISKSEGDEPQLLLYSANTLQSLTEMTEKWSSFLATRPPQIPLADISYTLANRRAHLPFRSFAIATLNKTTAAALPTSPGKASQLVMIFTGQGSQWPQMGRDLLLSNKTFRRSIRALDSMIQDLGSYSPTWKIEDELLKPSRESRVNMVEFSQPLCTAIQIALVDTLSALGLKPSAVVGHSSGEIAAAYAAGGLTAKEAITVALLRGMVCGRSKRPGAMAAVSLGWQDVKQDLLPGVTVACENSLSSVTLSGDPVTLKAVTSQIKKNNPGVLVSFLKVNTAYHSEHMVDLGEEYYRVMKDAGVVGFQPLIPFFSSVKGEILTSEAPSDDLFGPRYWQLNLESPVLFSSAVSSLLQHETGLSSPVFLEIGPHAALAGPIRQILSSKSTTAPHVATLMRQQNSCQSFLNAIGKLWTLHLPVNLAALVPEGRCLPDLPRYPWHHQKGGYWNESRVSKEWRCRPHPFHDLLGAKVPESSAIEPLWRNILHVENVSWIRDHKIRGVIIFPFAAYVAMAAEAVCQITGVADAVELRHITVNNSLVMNEQSPSELLTSFRKYRLTDTMENEWWEFTITSYNGKTWTKHCFGQVRAASPSLLNHANIPKPELLPNKVHMASWYERVKRAGLEYGDQFKAIEEMSTSSGGSKGSCVGRVRNNKSEREAPYHVHPIVVDNCFQILASAANHGITHGYRQLIPLSVDYLAISRCSEGPVEMTASSEVLGDGIVGEVKGSTGSEMCLSLSGVRLVPLDASDERPTDVQVPITARSEWVPHVDFADVTKLVEPAQYHTDHLSKLELLAKSAAILSKRALSDVKTSSIAPHLEKYRNWLLETADPDLEAMDNETLANSITSLVTDLEHGPAAHAARAISRIYSNITSILSSKLTGRETLSADDILPKLYRFMASYDISNFILCLAQCRPNLRILELGTGFNPVANGHHWDKLVRPSGDELYSKYVYVEAIPAMTLHLQERFKGNKTANLEFATLDARHDPDEQGFEHSDFDLVIANVASHMLPSISHWLANVKKLLRPGGRLLVQQPREGLDWTKYVLGTLPEWWCGTEDGRSDEPYVHPDRWRLEMTAAGFNRVRGVSRSSDSQLHDLSTVLIAESYDKKPASEKQVVVLHRDGELARADALTAQLADEGYRVTTCTLEDKLPQEKCDVISTLDFQASFLNNIDKDSFEKLKKLVESLAASGSGMFWLTRPSQSSTSSSSHTDPKYALIIGFARTVRSEVGIDFATCETDELYSSNEALSHLVRMFKEFYEREQDAVLGSDSEYLITNGITYVNRYFPFRIDQDVTGKQHGLKEAILELGTPGRLDSLYWASVKSEIPQGDEVEVEVYATGLNFRDVLVAGGAVELRTRVPALGCEAAGVIRRVGQKVTKFHVGDRVVVLGTRTFATTLTITELLCTKLPDDLTFAEGASMPVVFATAIQSLVRVARLEKDQSVLIHSGCGGVGLASIQIARMIGAEIYTTVGSEDKAQFLMEHFDIPRDHIYSSRHTSFADDLMRQTEGRGVDVALNSLSGELLHATWRCVAKYGMMVEIGKRDLWGGAKLDMKAFLANRSYCCVDLYQMAQERPKSLDSILGSMMEYYYQGFVKPVVLAKVFGASAVANSMRYMQPGSHIGKITVAIRDDSTGSLLIDNIVPVRSESDLFDPAASYILVGGLGGLGQSVSVWMVRHGVRYISLMSRHAGDDTRDLDLVSRLEGMGCTVQLIRGDVTNEDDVANAITGVPKPLKGIIQMTMVLRDDALSRMTIDDWNAVTRPKVRGTWNLHEVLQRRGLDLDFFVLISSVSGIVGQVGQANYAAANTFLDSFVKYRTSMGLPCGAIAAGPVEGVGYLAERSDLVRKLKGVGWCPVTEDEILEALGVTLANSNRDAIQKQSPSSTPALSTWTETIKDRASMLLGVAPDILPGNSGNGARDARMAVYYSAQQQRIERGGSNTENQSVLRSFLSTARDNPATLKMPEAAKLLATEMGKKLFVLLLKPDQEPDIALELAQIGLDSLVAVEMRAWWKSELGLTISVLEMLSMGTLLALGEKAAKELADQYDG
ncbi:hypothetical protein F4777DRAFT_589726 [Nemania sp. FL0916]|nr:hypothetical protein F4777DRAFT_589726 [Nemania sp. FL0916]